MREHQTQVPGPLADPVSIFDLSPSIWVFCSGHAKLLNAKEGRQTANTHEISLAAWRLHFRVRCPRGFLPAAVEELKYEINECKSAYNNLARGLFVVGTL